MTESIITFSSEEEKEQFEKRLKEQVAMPLSEESHSTLDEESATKFMQLHLQENLDSNPEIVRKLNETKKRASQTVIDLSNSWVRLRSILNKYQTTLHHRWMNRNVTKRKKLLLEAWPGMSAQHRPDFHALMNDLSGPRQQDAYLLPYINLTDLSRPHHLLNFFQSRAMHTPEVFAWSDSRTVQTASNMKLVEVPQSYGHTILLTTPKRYGKIVSFNDKAWSIMDVAHSKSFHLGEGLLTLEIQSKILAFLVLCTELLLHDQDLQSVPLYSPSDSLSGALKSADAVAAPKPTEWRSRMKANTEAAYEVPRQSSLQYLRGLAVAKKDEVEDGIWALRENPSYFQDALENRRQELRTLSRKLTRNDQAPYHPKYAEEIRQQACRDVVLDAYKRLVMWDTFSSDLRDLLRHRDILGLQESSTKRPPKEYMDALTNFLMLQRVLILTPKKDLELSVSFSQPLEQYYELESVLPSPAKISLRRKQLMPGQTPPILLLIDTLLDENKSFLMGTSNITDEMERLMDSESSQRKLISATVAKRLSEVSAIGELQSYLDQHQPSIVMPKDLKACVDEAQQRVQVIEEIKGIFTNLNLAHKTTDDPQVDYPIGRASSAHNTEKMRLAEGSLDGFWRDVDVHCELSCGKTLNGLMGARIGNRQLLRTSPWQPTAPTQNKEVPRRLSNRGPIPQHVKRPSPDPSIPKTKAKTRGSANPPHDRTPSYIPELQENPTAAKLRVLRLPARAYHTMCALFPSTRQERTPGKVLWDDFLHAFYKMDFEIWKQVRGFLYFPRSREALLGCRHPSVASPHTCLKASYALFDTSY